MDEIFERAKMRMTESGFESSHEKSKLSTFFKASCILHSIMHRDKILNYALNFFCSSSTTLIEGLE